MRSQKSATLLALLTSVLSSSAWANCGDTICSVDMGAGQTSYMDYGLCSMGTQPIISLTDASGNELKDANGKVTVLPNDPAQSSNPATTDATYILAGFWSDSTSTKLKFVDGSGATVFDLELLDTSKGMMGYVTSTVPGLVVTNAAVSCTD